MFSKISTVSRALAGVAVVAVLGAPLQAAAADDGYPSKSVTVIYPWAPGGGMETALRIMTDRISQSTGHSFVVDNRTGGGGSIAAQVTASAKPDGYTVLVAPIAIGAITPHLRQLPYEPLTDFVPVAQLSRFDAVISSSKKRNFQSLQEMIAYAKANPGALTFASAGVGTQGHLIGEMVQKAWDIELLHVPYKGAAESIADLVEGRIDLSFDVTLLQYAKDGRVNLLATFTQERLEDFPDLPTLAEAGVAEVDAGTWFGAFAPAGTPPERVAALGELFNESMNDERVVNQMDMFAMRPAYVGSEGFRQILHDDHARYGKLIKELGIKLD